MSGLRKAKPSAYFSKIVALAVIPFCFVDGKAVEFHNQCSQTIWVGAQGNPLPFQGGFQLLSGETVSQDVTGTTTGGRFWARTGCRNTTDGKFVCDTGDCGAPANNFGIHCGGIGGQPPATLIQFNFHEENVKMFDMYDLSNVDGFNVGIKMEALGRDAVGFECGAPSCAMNISLCPPELRIVKGSSVMCASICTAIHNAEHREKFPKLKKIYADKNTGALVCCACLCPSNTAAECNCNNPVSKHCCSPSSRMAPAEQGTKCEVAKWPRASNGQEYPRVFRDQCPQAYSWPFDEPSAYHCKRAEYRVTFCPQ
ncbi:uncharacterized protein LOC129596749 [Paramacrobiotus metropolitanus]|uniref:uncharacterized protein LOC129596749 n=1 Tax=Paramacrobiotus metropolitanus TaxID=2943436 RepID=UPI002445AC99|nr:uncharacterized protein LOC129596749 [Paramacrobiotus metropolitanus]